jgi:hypothetical protein
MVLIENFIKNKCERHLNFYFLIGFPLSFFSSSGRDIDEADLGIFIRLKFRIALPNGRTLIKSKS